MIDGGTDVLGTYHFVTTAKASADAHALVGQRLGQLDVVIDSAAVLFGLLVAVLGQPLGLLLAGAAAVALATTRVHPVQRWLISKRFRSLLGRTTTVTVGVEGVRFESEIGSAFMPWSSVTAVRSNTNTVSFIRDRVLLGYIPASAFPSAAVMAEVVAFANERTGSAQRTTSSGDINER